MLNARMRVFLLAAVVLAAGCGGGGAPGLTRIDRPGQRMQIESFSVVPPLGNDWYVSPARPQDEVWRTVGTFVKPSNAEATGGAIWAAVAVANLDIPFQSRDHLLAAVVRIRQTELQTGRFRLLEFRAVPGPSAGCQRYDALVEDRGVVQFPGSVFVLSLHHAICVHPNAPTMAVNVSYSERRRQGQQPAPLEAEGEPFLRSVQFGPLERPAVVATIDVLQDPQGVVADGRFVWVAELGNNSVARIDPRTNTVVKRYQVGTRPVGIAIGEGAVWVAANGADEVWSIDLQTDELRGPPIRVGREPLDVAVGFGSVWVTNMTNGTVSRIDPRTRQLVATIPVGSEPIGLAVGATGVWVASFRDSRVWRIDPRSNQVIGAPLTVGAGPSAVTASPGGIWIASQSAAVSRIDEAQGGVATIAVGQSASGVAPVGQQIWVTDYLGGVVWRIDPASRRVISPSIPVGKGPVRLTAGSGAVWVTNVGSGTVSRIAGF